MTERSVLNRRPWVAQSLVSQGVLKKSDLGDGTEPFVLDEVARWVKSQSTNQRTKLLEDSPVRAPFPRIWVEFRYPHTADCFVGVLVVNTKYRFDVTVYDVQSGVVGKRVGTMSVDLSEDGHLASDIRVESLAGDVDGKLVTINGGGCCMAAFALLNAKNVTAPRHFPNRAARRQRARNSNGDDPFVCYRMLRIEASHSTRDSRGRRITTNSPLTAEHIVRGHWAVYTEDKPMFGRLGDDRFVGRFWVTPHLRGDQAKGAIAKGYVVEADNEALICNH